MTSTLFNGEKERGLAQRNLEEITVEWEMRDIPWLRPMCIDVRRGLTIN